LTESKRTSGQHYMPESLLAPKQVADWPGISVAWVLDHPTRRRPRLASVKLAKAVRFRWEDAEQFIAERPIRVFEFAGGNV
jgi:hypothetical protein